MRKPTIMDIIWLLLAATAVGVIYKQPDRPQTIQLTPEQRKTIVDAIVKELRSTNK